MGWERRRDRVYYYRYAGKVDGRTVKMYLGKGPSAEAVAADVARRSAEREIERQERHRVETIAATIREQKRLADATVAATLHAAGFHRHHRGEWRKRRHVEHARSG